MHVAHNLMESLVHFIGGPTDVHGVLRHFETARCHTARVDGLARSEAGLLLDEVVNGFGCAAHVADFGYELYAVGHECLGIFKAQFVLCGARQGDVHLLFPWLAASKEGCFRITLGVGLDDVLTAQAEFEHIVNLLAADARGVIDVAIGTAEGHNLCAEFNGLAGCTPSHVAET